MKSSNEAVEVVLEGDISDGDLKQKLEAAILAFTARELTAQ